jgi:hypothetical protein
MPLHLGHAVADAGNRTGHVPQVTDGGKMICVRVSIEDPFQGEFMGLDMTQQLIGRCRSCRTRSWIKVKDWIDDGTLLAYWVRNHILDAAGCCLVESSYMGFVRPCCW